MTELAIEIRSSRFYDSLKGRLVGWLRNKLGSRFSSFAELALLLPDIVVLLGRVILDRRVPRKLRIKVGVILTYVSSPLDLIPEAVLGPLGLAEDLVLLAFALNKVLSDVDEEILEEHWSGKPEHLATLREIADIVDGIFSGRVGSRLRTWYEEEPGEIGSFEETAVEVVSEETEDEEVKVERLRASGL
ncbi:MAG TPA: DUF1232 domain-containing protein [archaeon]|nr:DUF1232 domain-containing protein [archaeon]